MGYSRFTTVSIRAAAPPTRCAAPSSDSAPMSAGLRLRSTDLSLYRLSNQQLFRPETGHLHPAARSAPEFSPLVTSAWKATSSRWVASLRGNAAATDWPTGSAPAARKRPRSLVPRRSLPQSLLSPKRTAPLFSDGDSVKQFNFRRRLRADSPEGRQCSACRQTITLRPRRTASTRRLRPRLEHARHRATSGSSGIE